MFCPQLTIPLLTHKGVYLDQVICYVCSRSSNAGYDATADARTIAIHLILEFWKCEAEYQDLDHFHWINHTGLLDVADIKSIAREVW